MAAHTTLVPFTVCVLVTHLLLLCAAATDAVMVPTGGGAAPPAAATVGGGGGGAPLFPFPGGLPLLPVPGGSAAASGCLKAVQLAESCVADVLRSLASPPGDAVRVGAACCGALQAVGDACIRAVLPVSPFRALYAPLVKQACGLPPSLIPGPRG